MNVFDLFASLSLDKGNYENGLGEAEQDADSFGSKIGNALGKAGKVAGASLAALGAGVVAVGTEFASGISKVASYGDTIDKMSQKLGISAKAYQEWDFIAQHAGTSVEGLQTSMKTLAKAVQDASSDQAEAFEALGLSLEDLQGMSQEDVFSKVITGLQSMEAGTKRTAIASNLLGKSATELGALLNMSAEDTEAMRNQVYELGGVLSDDAISASATYADSLQNLQTAISGLSNGMFSDFLPAIVDVMDGLTGIFSGDESGIGKISKGIDSFITKLSDRMPQIVDFASQLIENLGTAIITNLPKLVESASQLILQLSKYLIENLPLLIATALEIIVALANGLIEAIPELIPATVDVILNIVDYLLDNIELLIDCAVKLTLAIAEGLVKAIPQLAAKVPEIIKAIVNGLTYGLSAIRDVGKNLIEGLWNGINDKVQWLKDKIAGFGQTVLGTIKGIFGIHSPSRVFRDEIGAMLALGLGEGWDDEISDVKKGIESDLQFDAPAIEVSKFGQVSEGTTSESYNVNLTEAIKEALDSYEIRWNDRNLGRLVRTYA